MIIVSQVKRNIINFDNVESIYIVADLNGTGKIPYKIYYETSTQSEELGQYATEERAKEILEEITAAYQASELFKCVDKNVRAEMTVTYMENKITPFKYEMPEE